MRKFIFFLVITALFIPRAANASSGALSVTPSIIRLDLDQEEAVASLFYKNTSSSTISLSFSAQDFSDLEEGYRVKFLDENDAKNYHYSLSSWIKFERQTMDLNPGEQRELKVFIDKNRLSPGAHYGAIEAQFRQFKDSPGKVGIQGVLSSLLFVRASTGKEIDSANIRSISVDQPNAFSFPRTSSLSFQNTGNTDLSPHGVLQISYFGNVIAKGILNEDSLITLPESIRVYNFVIYKLGGPILPGMYNAKLTIDYGKNNVASVSNMKFFYAGSLFMPILVLVLSIIIAFRLLRKFTLKKKSGE